MKKKTKKKVLNIIMAALIVAVAACGIMTAGSLRGWFGGGGSVSACDITGIVNIERDSVAYTLDKKTNLKSEDILETKSGASVTVAAGGNTYALSENSELTLAGIKDKRLSLELGNGEVFAALEDGGNFGGIEAGGCDITAADAVFSVNVQKGSMGIRVFCGSVTADNGKKNISADAGQEISIVGKKMTAGKLAASSLNDFNIENAKKAGDDFDICFSSKELDKVVSDREKEIRKAEKERLSRSKEAKASGKKSSAEKNSSSKTSSMSKSSSSKKSSSGKKSAASSGSSTKASSGGKSAGSSNSSTKNCTIAIKCTSILSNTDDLTKGKEKYVPSDGTILAASAVELQAGDTVFDVLKRACSAAGIQLEYSYSAGYGTNYIEGINHLYEFDCGSQSGWIYKVNGWAPNYGCSEYKLKGGESIVWSYTCDGM